MEDNVVSTGAARKQGFQFNLAGRRPNTGSDPA